MVIAFMRATMTIVDLTLKRLDRLEKQSRETNDRLGRLEESLERVATILETHSRHFERVEDVLIGISERFDRFTAAIARGRTQDLARFADHERRIRSLERTRRTRRHS